MEQEPTKMSSGEALAKILESVERIEAKIDRAEEVIEVVVEQVQEVAATGIGNILSGSLNGGLADQLDNVVQMEAVKNGDSGDSEDQG